jgi:FkbM family methyltransferase
MPLTTDSKMISYASNHEDVLLQRCFPDVADGFYVDIGAGHPTNWSVTRWFYDRGWRGINVEPGPSIEALRTERSRDVNLEVAVADFEGEATLWIHAGNEFTSTLSESVAQNGVERSGEMRSKKVRVVKLESILDQHARDQHIHFLKIDVEGVEDAIVRSTDWRRYRPEVLLVESTEPFTSIRRREPWQDWLQKNGYTFAYFDGINDFWIRNESLHLQAAFAVPVNVMDDYTPYNVMALRETIKKQIAGMNRARARIKGLLTQIAELQGRQGGGQAVPPMDPSKTDGQ